MTATTVSPTTSTDTTATVQARQPAIPTTRLIKVELRKMFDTRSGFWMLLSIGVLSVMATGATSTTPPAPSARDMSSTLVISCSSWSALPRMVLT